LVFGCEFVFVFCVLCVSACVSINKNTTSQKTNPHHKRKKKKEKRKKEKKKKRKKEKIKMEKFKKKKEKKNTFYQVQGAFFIWIPTRKTLEKKNGKKKNN